MLKQFLKDESGQDLVEYALIVAAVGLGAISVVSAMSVQLQSTFQSIIADLRGIGQGIQ
jgi:pilus assembly protein Flp/PilA